MPDFLAAPIATEAPIAPLEVLIRLIIAVALGFIVSWIYRKTRPATGILPSFPPTLVLMATLIAMVTQVVGDSVARAFSLVGALSIVRFRTVVRDTQDTAFVIFAVVVGMASGASDPRLAVIGIGVVGAAAFLMRPRTTGKHATVVSNDAFVLRIRLAANTEVEAAVGAVLDEHLIARQLTNMSTAKQGLAVDATYAVRFNEGRQVDGLVRALNGVPSVMGVEVRPLGGDADPDDDD